MLRTFLALHAATALKVAITGATGRLGRRAVEKLVAQGAAVRDELGAPADTPLVVTDTTNPASLQALMNATRLVLTTVGPYQLYGNELVAACAASGGWSAA